MKKLFLLLSLLCSLSYAGELSLGEENKKAALILDVLAPKECGNLKLNRYENSYSLSMDDEEQEIPNYMVSKPLRKMNPGQLAGFLKTNYISLKPCSDGTFALEDQGRLHGGGPFSAASGYLAGKWGGQAVVLVTGYAVLLGATGVVTVVGGKEAGKEFFVKVQEQSIPHLWKVSEKISHATGAAGGVAGIFVPGA